MTLNVGVDANAKVVGSGLLTVEGDAFFHNALVGSGGNVNVMVASGGHVQVVDGTTTFSGENFGIGAFGHLEVLDATADGATTTFNVSVLNASGTGATIDISANGGEGGTGNDTANSERTPRRSICQNGATIEMSGSNGHLAFLEGGGGAVNIDSSSRLLVDVPAPTPLPPIPAASP